MPHFSVYYEILPNSYSYHREDQDLVEINALLRQLSASAPTATFKGIRNSSHVLVARYSDTGKAESLISPVAGVAVLVSFTTLTGYRGRVEDVVVREDLRGRGIGHGLMQFLIGLAKQKELDSIELTSRPERESANRLYQSIGFKKRETNVYRLQL